MFSEPYFLKFKIDVENLEQNQKYLWLHLNDNVQKFKTEFEVLVENDQVEFAIQHLDLSLYFSEQTFINNHAIIKSITVDNFWIFSPPWLFNEVVYDKKYIEHVKSRNPTWETALDKNCQSLHFNGHLLFKFQCPVIRNFK